MSVRALRRGAIAASRVQAPATVNTLSLPGTSGNYASTPDSAANSMANVIDFRIKLSMPDWTPSGTMYFLQKGRWDTNTISYVVDIKASGVIEMAASQDGGGVNARFVTTSSSTGFADGAVGWIRATYERSVGGVGQFTFYKRTGDADPWTVMPHSGGTHSPLTTIYNSTGPLQLGGSDLGTFGLLNGKIYYAELRDGIDGTIVAKYDPSTVTVLGTRNPTTLVSSTGETWTMNGSAWDWVAA